MNRLLTWRRTRAYALILIALYVTAWGYVTFSGVPPLNSSDTPIGGDYIAFHTAGRLLLAGDAAHLYDVERVRAIQDVTLGGRIPGFLDTYRNPPFFAVLFAPLALLDLIPSFALYSLLSVGVLGLAVWLALDEVPSLKPRWRGVLIFVFAFAPVYFGIINGMNSTLSLLLYVLIYRALVRGQDGAAGAWAALGLFKPQLFFVFPLVLLAARRWRALAAYGAVAAGLGVASLVLVGVEGMQGWVRTVLDMENGNAAQNAWRMQSLKALFDLLLPGQVGLTWALFAASVVGLLAVLVRAWAAPVPERLPLLFAFTSLVAVLVDPHLVDYDLSVLVLAGLLALPRLRALRWWTIGVAVLLVARVQVPIGPLSVQVSVLLLGVCAALVWRAYRAPRLEQDALTTGDGVPAVRLHRAGMASAGHS